MKMPVLSNGLKKNTIGNCKNLGNMQFFRKYICAHCFD